MSGPIVVDFIVLRGSKKDIKAETEWMVGELKRFRSTDDDIGANIQEANGLIRVLKRVALLQRVDRPEGSINATLTIR